MRKMVKIKTYNDVNEMTLTRTDNVIQFTVQRGSKRGHNELREKTFSLTAEQIKKVVDPDTGGNFKFPTVCIQFFKESQEDPTVWVVFYDFDSKDEKEIIIISAKDFVEGCKEILRD